MPGLSPKDLLLAPRLEPDEVTALLTPYRFQDIKKADANLQLIADEPRARHLLAEILEELLDCLARSPDPDQALNYLERFTKATYNKVQLFSYLKASPYTLWLLAKLLASSPFLSEILIRNPPYLYWIADPQTLDADRTKASLARELAKSFDTFKNRERRLRTLCLFKRKELLRIGVRDLLGKSTVDQTTVALSTLAEVILQKTYELCEESLQNDYGIPRRSQSTANRAVAAFTILGMGKLGGGELNFSSDVDLLYLYDSPDGKTSGSPLGGPATRISNREYFQRLAQAVTSSLTEVTNDGYLYRTDLRLRPEGKSGTIASALTDALHYYTKRGETWERLALLKAWPVAGSQPLGRRFLTSASPFIYRQPFSLKNLSEVRAIKAAIDRTMEDRGELERNVKLGRGGIREIEFLVQSIQAFFGAKRTSLRERNTLRALEKLRRHRILDRETASHLGDAYRFLRNVEHRLQMVHELQTHSLPSEMEQLRICALRLDYRDTQNATAVEQLLNDYRLHTGRVHRIFRTFFATPKHSSILQAAQSGRAHPASKRLAKNR